MLQHGTAFESPKGAAKRKVIPHDGWRVGLTLLWIAITASQPDGVDAALCGVPVLFAVIGAGMRWTYLLARLLLAVPFGLAAVIMLPLASGADTWKLAGAIMIKLAAANLGITYILGTTPVPLLLRTLRRLRVPGPFVDMIGFTLRYVGVLSEEARTMWTAQMARGLRPGAWSNWRSYKRTGRLLGVLLERALERSRRIHASMLARGYRADNPELPEWLLDPQAALRYKKEGETVGRHPHRPPVVPVSGCDLGSS